MIDTISWEKNKVKLIDQTKLPNAFKYIYCSNLKQIWLAIRKLQVRGAPALGVAGALGVLLGIKDSRAKNYEEFIAHLNQVIVYLRSARPTAVNIFWALDRMEEVVLKNPTKNVPRLKRLLEDEAMKIIEEDKTLCRRMGRYGVGLLKSGDTVLTHCNAGALATFDYGTALGLIYAAKDSGKKIKVYADETRPLLQGARLTAWELKRHGIDVTLICDNMAAAVMAQGLVDKVIVGADRIASNGDTANKIGTYNVAILASFHKLPFYVVAPSSTFDLTLKSGKGIPIEERSRDEVIKGFGRVTAPIDVKVYNPAFDVTPHNLITAFVTEKGVLYPPFEKSLRKLVK